TRMSRAKRRRSTSHSSSGRSLCARRDSLSGCPWAAISSTPTRSRWRKRWKGDGRFSTLARPMATPDLVMYEEEYQQIKDTLHRLQVDSQSKIVFLVDKNGQQIAVQGDMRGVDATSLASLTAGNVAATDGLAKLIGEKEFSILFHEGERDNIHISLVAQRAILVVIFDEKSSLGLVRLRVKKASQERERTFEQLLKKPEAERGSLSSRFDSPF